MGETPWCPDSEERAVRFVTGMDQWTAASDTEQQSRNEAEVFDPACLFA